MKVAVADDRSTALLLRVWTEAGADEFRARLLAIGPDGQQSDRTVALASSPDDVLDAVSSWLEEFLRYRTATD
jgi:hypothetical protein